MPTTIEQPKSIDPRELRFLTLAEAAGILRISLPAMRTRLSKRELPFYRIRPGAHGQIRIREVDLQKYIADNFVASTGPGKPIPRAYPRRRTS